MSRLEPKNRRDQRRNHLARALRDWRAQNGFPLKKVAAEFGVTEATWSRWESGDRFPTHAVIQPLANFVKLPVCRFFCTVEPRCPQCLAQAAPVFGQPAGGPVLPLR
jgi:transcriptional regulator with XRE-family HTH domain